MPFFVIAMQYFCIARLFSVESGWFSGLARSFLFSPMNPPQKAAKNRKQKSDYETMDAFLARAATALTNAQLPAIAPLLAARSITVADLKARLADVEQVRRLNQAQQLAYGEQFEATQQFEKARKRAAEDYGDARKLAKVAFRKDMAAQTALGLNVRKARTQSGFISQGKLFYENALTNAGYTTALAAKGVTLADLQAGKLAFENLPAMGAAQKKKMGDAQHATKARNRAFAVLEEWMADFYATVRVALRKHGQLMEQLGMVVPS